MESCAIDILQEQSTAGLTSKAKHFSLRSSRFIKRQRPVQNSRVEYFSSSGSAHDVREGGGGGTRQKLSLITSTVMPGRPALNKSRLQPASPFIFSRRGPRPRTTALPVVTRFRDPFRSPFCASESPTLRKNVPPGEVLRWAQRSL